MQATDKEARAADDAPNIAKAASFTSCWAAPEIESTHSRTVPRISDLPSSEKDAIQHPRRSDWAGAEVWVRLNTSVVRSETRLDKSARVESITAGPMV